MDTDLQKVIITKIKVNWHKANSLYNNYAKSVGLNITAIFILDLLYNSNDIYTQKTICAKLEQPKQLVNSIITSFWQQGFVELREAKDRRNKIIVLTDKGVVYARKTLKPLQDAEERVLESLTADELSVFDALLEKTNAIFEK